MDRVPLEIMKQRVSTATEAKSRMRVVTAASPAIKVNDFEIVVPILRGPTKAVQLDHRQREIKSKTLGLLDDLTVQIEARHVLG
jgi:hypothetical protein